jgi:hypothetical protein
MQLYVDRPIPAKLVGVTGYVLLFISWAGYFLGRILWPSLHWPWPCVEAPYGCSVAFIAGILALIVNLKRWPWWFFLTIAAFISYGYIALSISDI